MFAVVRLRASAFGLAFRASVSCKTSSARHLRWNGHGHTKWTSSNQITFSYKNPSRKICIECLGTILLEGRNKWEEELSHLRFENSLFVDERIKAILPVIRTHAAFANTSEWHRGWINWCQGLRKHWLTSEMLNHIVYCQSTTACFFNHSVYLLLIVCEHIQR